MGKNKENKRTPRQRRRFRARKQAWVLRNSDTPAQGSETPFEGGFLCHYCRRHFRRKHKTRDHIVPKAWQGENEEWNIVPACRPCNRAKGSNPPTCDCEKCVQSLLRHQEIWKLQGLIVD